MYEITWSYHPLDASFALYKRQFNITHFSKPVIWWTQYIYKQKLEDHFSVDTVISILKSGGFFVLDLSRDPVWSDGVVITHSFLFKFFKDNNLSLKQLIILCPSFLDNGNKFDYGVLYFNSLFMLTRNSFKNDYLREKYPLPTRNIEKHFLSLNRKDAFHRRYLNFKLHDTLLFDKGYVAHNRKKEEPYRDTPDRELLKNDLVGLRKGYMRSQKPKYWFDFSKRYLKGFLKHTLEVKKHQTKAEATNDYPFHQQVSKLVFFELVTETFVDDIDTFLTEKTFKAILSKNIFLIWGNPNTLALLRDLGFKTFNHLFDESYDQERNMFIRLNMILDNVDKLCSIPITTCKKIYDDNLELLDYNYNHYLNTKWDFELFNKLDNYIRSSHD